MTLEAVVRGKTGVGESIRSTSNDGDAARLADISLDIHGRTGVGYAISTGVMEMLNAFAGEMYKEIIGAVIYPSLGDVTMRHIHRNLQECLDRAVNAGLMAENPARAFHYAIKRKATATVLSSREIDDYLDAAEELGLLPMFSLMLTVGLRQRELLALKWSDLNESTGVLTVAEGRVVIKGRLVDYGGGAREICLPAEVAALLRQEHDRHPSSELMFMHPGTQKPYPEDVQRHSGSRAR